MNESNNPTDLIPNDENENRLPTPGLDNWLRRHPDAEASNDLQRIQELFASFLYTSGQRQLLASHDDAVTLEFRRNSR